MRFFVPVFCLCISAMGAMAAEGRDWQVPPRGISISDSDRVELRAEVDRLGEAIEKLRVDSKAVALLPDVEVFHKAVDWALAYQEFYKSNQVTAARDLLREGLKRAEHLQAGEAPWLVATGLVVRGYVSRLDGSVQPYGLVVPASYRPGKQHRLDVWLHGRDNFLTELKFINGRMKSAGQFTPPDTLVLHPYGRFCNAFKFAGEVDVLEALEHVKTQYRVDENRLGIRGFSMGGAGCWHLAAHHAGLWAAAAPGAGFAETAEYAGVLKKKPLPSSYEQELWHLYDATDYAANLFNCPTIAYSGELDSQKQAADIMDRALTREGLKLAHIIGPGTKHKYEPVAKRELIQRFDVLMKAGRAVDPKRVRFTTWTLRYNEMHWVRVEAMEQHWKRARVEAALVTDTIGVNTENVSGFSIRVPASFGLGKTAKVLVDGDRFTVPLGPGKESVRVAFTKDNGKWAVGSRVLAEGDSELRVKRAGLQGPIDDAFMDSFLVVRPTGVPLSTELGNWVTRELTHATNEWRGQFRGYARLKDDRAVTKEDIANHNLVLWGDPRSNRLLAQILDQLPVRWDAEKIEMKGKVFSADKHVPVLIFPNPLNPRRYVVLNSGFTFCESGKQSNSLQTPKLPDYAVLDMTVPIGQRHPGGVVMAGFFDENWE